MKPQTQHWLEMAEYDLGTAEAMFKSRRYVYVIFMCHLCIEKALKACVAELADLFPPYTHSLTKLLETAQLDTPAEITAFISKLSDMSVTTRYPENLKQFQRKQAQEYLARTREVYSWLEQHLTSSE